MTAEIDNWCDRLRIRLHGLDRRLEALKANQGSLSEKSRDVVQTGMAKVQRRMADAKSSIEAAHVSVAEWAGDRAGLEGQRAAWRDDRRFLDLNDYADRSELHAEGAFELAIAAADKATEAAMQAVLARSDATLASLPAGYLCREDAQIVPKVRWLNGWGEQVVTHDPMVCASNDFDADDGNSRS
jgi:hypothetical protein